MQESIEAVTEKELTLSLLPDWSWFRVNRFYYQKWLSLPWFIILVGGFSYQFWLGFRYNSNETTNLFLQLSRGCAYTLLLAICVLWLPVMRHGLAILWRSRWMSWIPLEKAKTMHRWLGHLIMLAAFIHGTCYLLYFNSLNAPLEEIILGTEADLVRSMKTTMYEFVSEDESISIVEEWIENGAPKDDFHSNIRPILKEDCTKCHNASSTMTYAIPSLPLSSYNEVISLSQAGAESRQFRINSSGILMLLIVLILWVSSLAYVRKNYHHVFQRLHRLGYLLVILSLLHIPRHEWIVVPAIILSIELYLSHYHKIYRGKLAHIKKTGTNFIRLEMPRPANFKIQPGHYLQLRIPCISTKEWHDFSLTGHRKNRELIVLKIKAEGNWTNTLLAKLKKNSTAYIVVDFRGPFASPAASYIHQKQCLMIAGGIGITPFLSFLYSILFEQNSHKQYYLVWVLRDSKLLKWIKPFANSSVLRFGKISIYVTGEKSKNKTPKWLKRNDYFGKLKIQYQRPNWPILFSSFAEEFSSPHCFVCGPDSLVQSVTANCRSHGWSMSIEEF